jgi:toxin-antitoxin system PIN domain toxin
VALVDANVLLSAHNSRAPHHVAAKSWLEQALAGSESVLVPMTAVLAFLRLATHPAVFASPLSVEQALDAVDAWLDSPVAGIPHPGGDHLVLLRRLLTPLGIGGNLVNDAHLAALAVENGTAVVSFDSDFSRFVGVRWRPPTTHSS